MKFILRATPYLKIISESTPWYLLGDIPEAMCSGAYRAKGATSFANSLLFPSNNIVIPNLTVAGNHWWESQEWGAGLYSNSYAPVYNPESDFGHGFMIQGRSNPGESSYIVTDYNGASHDLDWGPAVGTSTVRHYIPMWGGQDVSQQVTDLGYAATTVRDARSSITRILYGSNVGITIDYMRCLCFGARTIANPSPSFNSETGWTFDGRTQYLPINVNITDGRNFTFLIKFSGVTENTGAIAGYYDRATGAGLSIYPRKLGKRVYQNGTVQYTAGTYSTSGVIAVAGNKVYLDGVEETTLTTSLTTSSKFYIGGDYYSFLTPSVNTFFKGTIESVSTYLGILTKEQIEIQTALM